MMTFIVIILGGILGFGIVLLSILLLFARWNYGTLESLGIPVEKPSFFLGSCPKLHTQVIHLEDVKRAQKYGPVYGVYEGREPQVHVSDLELVYLICSKDASHFQGTTGTDLGPPIFWEMLDWLTGEKWKRVRNSLAAALSHTKLSQMIETTEASVANLLNSLQFQLNSSTTPGVLRLDLERSLSPFVMEYFTRALLGVHPKYYEDPLSGFLQANKNLLAHVTMDESHPFLFTLTRSFPFLAKIPGIRRPVDDMDYEDVFRRILEEGLRGDDHGSQSNSYSKKLKEMLAGVNGSEVRALGITDRTILAQMIAVFPFAQATMTSVLCILLYHLAKYSEVQDRVWAEVQTLVALGSNLDLDGLKYLSAVVSESLRIASPLIRQERVCTNEWNGPGLRVPKGTLIIIPTWALHRNPQIWSNPNKFLPERFLGTKSGGVPKSGLGFFGFGHRYCPGAKFSLETLKIIVARLVQTFKFQLRDDTRLNYKPGGTFLATFHPLYLDLLPRNDD